MLKAAAETLTHVHLELGGKNAIIVLDDADVELAVDGILWSAFGTSGQRCTAASRVIVAEGRLRRAPVAARRARREAAARAGLGGRHRHRPGDQPAPRSRRSTRTPGSARTRARSSSPAARSRPTATSARASSTGRPSSPTSTRRCGSRRRRSSARRPRSSRSRDLDEAISVSNGIKYGLSSSIFTRDVNAAFRAMRDLEAGITYVNAGTIGAEVHLPFGGTKDTGNGHREAGQAALDVFTEWKSIYVDYSGRLQRAQIDTEVVVEYRAARRQRSPRLGDLPRHVDDVRRQPRRRRRDRASSTPRSSRASTSSTPRTSTARAARRRCSVARSPGGRATRTSSRRRYAARRRTATAGSRASRCSSRSTHRSSALGSSITSTSTSATAGTKTCRSTRRSRR